MGLFGEHGVACFFVFLCLTVHSQLLLSSSLCDTVCWVETLKTQPDTKADKVFEIIDHVLKQVFGENGTCLIYGYLEHCHSLKPSDLSEKFDVFAKGLEEFLSSGASFIESKILNDMLATPNSRRTIDLQIR